MTPPPGTKLGSCEIVATLGAGHLGDEPPFVPRRLVATLGWPLEAPMIDAARFRSFRDVRFERGLSAASGARTPA